MVEIAPPLESNLDPHTVLELENKHAPCTPHGLQRKAGRDIASREVVARALEDWWPVELKRNCVDDFPGAILATPPWGRWGQFDQAACSLHCDSS